MSCPLEGIRVLEIASIGPGPFAGMMLADHGAEVIRIERIGGGAAGSVGPADTDILLRSRKRMQMDLKDPAAREVLLSLVRSADALIEGFRPGVMERLGLGPEVLLGENSKLVYGRMTGWGQTGPMADAAGHDLNYIALSGALHPIGRRGQPPTPPLNLVGDFGGGAMMLAFGVLAALRHAAMTGEGTVVDAAMTDGSALLTAMHHSFRAAGFWRDERGQNFIDSGAHFYDVYETADGQHISLGALESRFYAEMLERLGLAEDADLKRQQDRETWDLQRDKIAARVKTKTQAEWDAVFEGSDACYAPVLSPADAPRHPHNMARDTFATAGGVVQPTPAPRYQGLSTAEPVMADAGTHSASILADLGYSDEQVGDLVRAGCVG